MVIHSAGADCKRGHGQCQRERFDHPLPFGGVDLHGGEVVAEAAQAQLEHAAPQARAEQRLREPDAGFAVEQLLEEDELSLGQLGSVDHRLAKDAAKSALAPWWPMIWKSSRS